MAKAEFRIEGKPMELESKVETPGPSPLEDSRLRTGVADAAPQDSSPKTQDPPDSLHDKVVAAISEVYDPEIPVNIYQLGLIYDVAIDETNHVKVTMTLTSAACPAAQELPVEVRKSVECIPEVTGSEVDLVFDPPWSMEKMSDEAKLALGLL